MNRRINTDQREEEQNALMIEALCYLEKYGHLIDPSRLPELPDEYKKILDQMRAKIMSRVRDNLKQEGADLPPDPRQD